ncbi:MAG: signal recognition particle-docking protein FtsY [Deltaproteobacteria bacterium]|nr:signal recognition particle-docking protein FtsY [Deltaproteobacteria bacterium]
MVFDSIKAGLLKTRNAIVGGISSALGMAPTAETLEKLEESLLTADIGVETSTEIIEAIKTGSGKEPDALAGVIRSKIFDIMRTVEAPLSVAPQTPFVIMVLGVNGVGKTTTIGKLATYFSAKGKNVLIGAGDTFRAAAIEQLDVWCKRANCQVVKHSHGADPAAVAYDTIRSAISKKADVVILDTAGRLHTKTNLMEELKKIKRVMEKELPGAPHERLLVLDASTGQNALNQARLFNEAVGVTGIIVTKLDGTAKGGIIVPMARELKIPIRFIGVGESAEDLKEFNAKDFADAIV